MDCSSSGSSVHGGSSCKSTAVSCHALLQAIFPTQSQPRTPTLQADSLPSEPPGKPQNTGVSRLPLLQRIFPNQESNQGLLYFRQILYQLSCQASPHTIQWEWKCPQLEALKATVEPLARKFPYSLISTMNYSESVTNTSLEKRRYSTSFHSLMKEHRLSNYRNQYLNSCPIIFLLY